MSFFRKLNPTHVTTALQVSTFYFGGGILINAWLPILGSLYGHLTFKEDPCRWIEKGHKLGKLWFFPFTATYDGAQKIMQKIDEKPCY